MTVALVTLIATPIVGILAFFAFLAAVAHRLP